jgi:hypothetical protein
MKKTSFRVTAALSIVSFAIGCAVMFVLIQRNIITIPRGPLLSLVQESSVAIAPAAKSLRPTAVSPPLNTDSAAAERMVGGAPSLKTLFPGWGIENFYTPLLKVSRQNVRIFGEDGTSGVLFRRHVAAPSEFKLSVLGANSRNQVNLRITRDRGRSEWYDAPDGLREFTFQIESEIEVLIYADQTFEYELNKLELIASEGSKQSKSAPGLLQHSPQALASIGEKLGVSVALFGSGRVAEKSGRILISNAGSAGGIRFTFDSIKPRPHKFSIKGEPIHGKPSLRVGELLKPLRYIAPPDGDELSFVIGETGTTEFILYADSPFTYAINDIRITECKDCRSNIDLKAIILDETPGLAGALQSNRLEAARLILDWVAKNGNWTEDLALEAKTYPAVVANRAVETYYNIFQPNIGAVFCGGLAVFLNKVYHIFGYDSFVADFGYSAESDYTHLTTVIAQRAGTEWSFYIFDPWWNATFRDALNDGRFLPLFEIVSRIRETGAAEVTLDERSKAERDWLMPVDKRGVCDVVLEDRGGQLLCRVPTFTVAKFLKEVKIGWEKIGIPASVEGLFKLFENRVFSTSYSSNAEAMKVFRQRLSAYNIPYGYK